MNDKTGASDNSAGNAGEMAESPAEDGKPMRRSQAGLQRHLEALIRLYETEQRKLDNALARNEREEALLAQHAVVRVKDRIREVEVLLRKEAKYQ